MNGFAVVTLATATIGALLFVSRLRDGFSREDDNDDKANLQFFSGPYSELDLTAAARMLASENPRGSLELWVEQIFTQLRSRTRGQTLYARITAGSGYGQQGKKSGEGGVRPVSTEEKETEVHRDAAADVLTGKLASSLKGARRFFEPGQQDRAFAVAERAREKKKKGEKLTEQEERLILYRKNAAAIRADWKAKGHRYIGTIDGVEFYS